MNLRHTLAGAALAALVAPAALAADLPADGRWAVFDVDSMSASSGGLEWIDIGSGEALSFDFTIAAGQLGTLTVVDAGFAGDRFDVYGNGTLLGRTSAATASYPTSIGLDFDAAMADPAYSRASYTFGVGTWHVSGLLAESVLVDGLPLNATVGGLRLEVSPVPEPAPAVMLCVGLALVAVARRRRA